MHAAVTYDPEKLAAVCRKHGVRLLEAFGSVVRDDFDPSRSDVDLLCLYDRAKRRAFMREHGGLAAFAIREEMAEVFGRSCDFVDVDLVENPYFFANALRTRERLYTA